MSDLVRYDLADGFARIVMDDGRVNVMSLAMLHALHDAVDRAAADGAVAILSSARPVFSAGFDLKVFAAGDPVASASMVRAGAELALKLFTHPHPVVAACRGHAYPMGAFLLLASDIRLGGEGAWRIGLNEVAIGIPVPSFALELARARLHPAWLSRTATTGEMFSPADALTAGFLDRLVPDADLDAAALAAARPLAQVHRPSHATVKQRLRGGTAVRIRAAIDAEITAEAYRQSAAVRTAVKLPA